MKPMDSLISRSVTVVAIGLFLAVSVSLNAQTMTALTGVVKDMAGKRVEGALVRVRNAEAGATFMVVSQTQGRFNSPRLAPGKYMIEAVGGDYQSNPAGPVEVANGRPAKMDVVLNVARKATS